METENDIDCKNNKKRGNNIDREMTQRGNNIEHESYTLFYVSLFEIGYKRRWNTWE